MAGSWERLGMAWASAKPEDVDKADKEATERSIERVDAFMRRKAAIARAGRDDEGETQKQMVERALRRD